MAFLDLLFKKLSILLMLVYRAFGTFHIGGGCRFEPSCSEYALCCYERFSFSKATALTVKRLASCRPFGRFGYDPVPEKLGRINESRQ